MQFFRPENYFELRKALIETGRADRIGGCDGLISANLPKEALDDRQRKANEQASGEHYHKVETGGRGSRRAGDVQKRG